MCVDVVYFDLYIDDKQKREFFRVIKNPGDCLFSVSWVTHRWDWKAQCLQFKGVYDTLVVKCI